MKHIVFTLLASATLINGVVADDEFVPMFRDNDLSGWVNVNGAPETWSISNGVVHCTGRPTGALRTERQYENFILEGEWRHLKSGGNSGFFVWGTPIAAPGVPFLRGIEVQVLDNGFNVPGKNEWYTTHGDIFPIHGATMKPIGKVSKSGRSFPTEERSKSSPEWNHYRIVGSNGTIRLSVNGREISGGDDCNYRKGYLALESEGSPVEFRNVRIKELPSSGASAELTAPADQGWRSLFNGLDFRGWQETPGWKTSGERLTAGTEAGTLRTAGEFGDAEFLLDARTARDGDAAPVLSFRGAEIPLTGAAAKFQRFTVTVAGGVVKLVRGDAVVAETKLPPGAPVRGPLELRAKEATFFNLFARDL